MRIERHADATIITADRGKYLMLKDIPQGFDAKILGKQTRIHFANIAEIPELTELELNEEPEFVPAEPVYIVNTVEVNSEEGVETNE